MKYIPKYAPGKIVVNFNGEVHGDFEKQFGQKLGYKYMGEVVGGAVLYEVPVGQEQQAISRFIKHENFVSSAKLYDEEFYEKLSFRFDAIRELESIVAALSNDVEHDEKFQSDLMKVINYAKEIKKI
jgi:hypothetical protein